MYATRRPTRDLVTRIALREGDRFHVGSQVQLRFVYRTPAELEPVSRTAPPPASPLTGRELEVANLVAEGHSNEGVAARVPWAST